MQGQGLAKNRSHAHAAPRSIETLGEAILNLSGQIDSLLPSRPVIICLLYFILLDIGLSFYNLLPFCLALVP